MAVPIDHSHSQALTHDLAASFIGERYPDEREFFPSVWQQFLRWLAASSRSEATPDGAPVGGLPFAAQGQDTLVSPFVLLIVDAVFRELHSRGFTPDFAAVRRAINDAAQSLGAPTRLARELANDLGPRLCDIFSSSDVSAASSAGATQRSEAPHGSLWVEWCDDLVGEHGSPSAHRRRVAPDQVEADFVRHSDRYVLWVDERASAVLYRSLANNDRPGQTPVPVPWSALDPRHRFALGLFLEAFYHRRQVRYADLMDDADVRERKPALRAKSELDGLLGGTLKRVVKSVPNQDAYEIRGQIPYCWIRQDRATSKLLR